VTRPIRDFALEVHFSKYEFVARYNLTGSDAESHTVGEILALGSDQDRASFSDLGLGYTETFGAPRLRQAIAATYDSAAISHENVLTFAGAQEALYAINRVLLDPGDHAIIVTPNYQSAETMPASICATSGVPLDPEQNWRLDPDQLIAAIRPNTKLVSINFPNNSTGAVIPVETLDAIVSACRERGIWLLSDEVYRLLEADPARCLPQAATVYERAISLNVMSKAYGMPGLRIGWVACQDRALLGRLERYKHYLSICNSAPSELLARIALDHRDRIVDHNRAIIAENLDALDSFFADWPNLFAWQRPDGGCVAFPQYLGQDGVEVFTQRLVEEAGVLLLPASIYRSDLTPTPSDRFRIGFGRRHAGEALEVFGAWLRRAGR
jgi:aspartate/methionine/tyrosine aminotransferase